jgi:hypothetical protein
MTLSKESKMMECIAGTTALPGAEMNGRRKKAHPG